MNKTDPVNQESKPQSTDFSPDIILQNVKEFCTRRLADCEQALQEGKGTDSPYIKGYFEGRVDLLKAVLRMADGGVLKK